MARATPRSSREPLPRTVDRDRRPVNAGGPKNEPGSVSAAEAEPGSRGGQETGCLVEGGRDVHFAGKYSLNFTLLADVPDKTGTPRVCNAYGVWQEKESYGRRSMGVVRTTYLIDAQGRVARRFDRVRVDGHAAEVLAALG